MRTAIHQPNFLPWIGYFNKINSVDKFILLDDVQFERGHSFTNRTKLFFQNNEHWLTIPVVSKSELPLIKDIRVNNSVGWKNKHLRTLSLNFKNHPGFQPLFEIIEKIYASESEYLIDYNIPLIIEICNLLEIKTELVSSSTLGLNSLTGFEKLLAILKEVKAEVYLSGSGAGSRRYIDETILNENNISLEWQNFNSFEYDQIKNTSFIPKLSIIDLIFNLGKSSKSYIE